MSPPGPSFVANGSLAWGGDLFTALRRFVVANLVLVVSAALFGSAGGYYLWVHRNPYTQNAFVYANIRPVTAHVSGHITNIYVKDHQQVKKGAPLLTVYTRPYELKVEQLQHDIATSDNNIESLKNQILMANTEIKNCEAALANLKYLSAQATLLAKENAFAQKTAEEQQQGELQAQANYDHARYNFKKSIADLAAEQSKRLSLVSGLEIAKVQLALTTVYADSDGYVVGMQLSTGMYVDPGTPVFSFVDSTDYWVEANFKETQLSDVAPGVKADIYLWQHPGVVLHGEVVSAHWGVNRDSRADFNAMPQVQKENEWFLLPQRFPVKIRLTDLGPDTPPLRPGASAFVRLDCPSRQVRQLFWQLFQW